MEFLKNGSKNLLAALETLIGTFVFIHTAASLIHRAFNSFLIILPVLKRLLCFVLSTYEWLRCESIKGK